MTADRQDRTTSRAWRGRGTSARKKIRAATFKCLHCEFVRDTRSLAKARGAKRFNWLGWNGMRKRCGRQEEATGVLTREAAEKRNRARGSGRRAAIAVVPVMPPAVLDGALNRERAPEIPYSLPHNQLVFPILPQLPKEKKFCPISLLVFQLRTSSSS